MTNDLPTSTTYFENKTGTCPHCGTLVQFEACSARVAERNYYIKDAVRFEDKWESTSGVQVSSRDSVDNPVAEITLTFARRKACLKLMVQSEDPDGLRLIWPRSERPVVDASVPIHLTKDFVESHAVMPISVNAAAFLAGRCLENLLKGQQAKGKNLAEMIEDKLPEFPRYVQPFVDAVRLARNLATHPNQNGVPAESVEPTLEEVEWMLALVQELFEHYFVSEANSKALSASIVAKHKKSKVRSAAASIETKPVESSAASSKS